MKSCLEKNDMEMYSTHHEGKSVVPEKFIRTLKSKIYEYMTTIIKNVYIDKLDEIINKYNNTYRNTIKMKPVEVKSSAYIESSKEINYENPKFKILLEYQNIKIFLQKAMFQIFPEELFVIKKAKNIVSWTYVISDLMGEEIVGKFYEKKLQKANQKEFRVKKM